MTLGEGLRWFQVSIAGLLLGITGSVLIVYVKQKLRPKDVLRHLAYVVAGFAVLVIATAADAMARVGSPPDWRLVYLIGYALSGWGLWQLRKRAR